VEAIRDFRDVLNLYHHGEKKFSSKVFERFCAWEVEHFGAEASQSPRKRKRAGGDDEDYDMDELYEERDSEPPPSHSPVSVREVKKSDRTVRKFASYKLRSSVPSSAKKYRLNGESQSLESTPSTSQIGQAMGYMTMDSSPSQSTKVAEVDFGQPNDLLMK